MSTWVQVETIQTSRPGSTWDNEADADPVEPAPTQPPGYLARLKTAASDSFETAQRAPATLEEAIAVLRGERDVKPDFERAIYTVSAVSFVFQVVPRRRCPSILN